MQTQSDQWLVREIKAGNAAALNALLAKHRAAVTAQAVRDLRDADAAETAAQEVCLRVCRGLANFAQDAQFSTWLYRITHNVCLSMLEREHRERDKWQRFGTLQEAAEETDTPFAMNFAEMLEGLAPDEKQLLALRFMHDYELADIAQITSRSLSGTKMRLYRALDKIKLNVTTQLAA